MATLVIGIGNRHRRDDGAGCIAAALLSDLTDAGGRVVTTDGAGGTLLETWASADRVFIIDAARSEGTPGTILRFDGVASPLPTALWQPHSSHAFGLAESIELARALDSLPSQLVVYAIVGRDFEPGSGLTPEVARAADTVADQIRREIFASDPSALRANHDSPFPDEDRGLSAPC